MRSFPEYSVAQRSLCRAFGGENPPAIALRYAIGLRFSPGEQSAGNSRSHNTRSTNALQIRICEISEQGLLHQIPRYDPPFCSLSQTRTRVVFQAVVFRFQGFLFVLFQSVRSLITLFRLKQLLVQLS
jgi:hypothetical protein